jgi:hypothetical protein
VPPPSDETAVDAAAAADGSDASIADASTFDGAVAVIADAAVAHPAAASSSDTGLLKTTDATPHRRIFVDERVVGQTPESVAVKCGTRAVRLGSAGKAQSIDVPCGGEVLVGDK